MLRGRKQSDLNPKAREAFAKSSIDIGVGIFKALMLVIFILPVTLIAKAVFDGSSEVISVSEIFDSISSGVWFLFWFLVIVAILASAYYRDNGIKILHEMEEQTLRAGRALRARPYLGR